MGVVESIETATAGSLVGANGQAVTLGPGLSIVDGQLRVSTGPGGEAFAVGSVFTAVVPTDPATLLGYGTWTAFGAGRTLVGFASGDPDFGTPGAEVGSKTVTLTEAQMPPHGHPQNAHTHTLTDNGHNHIQNPHTHIQDAHSHTIPVGATDDTAAPFDRADAGTNASGVNATTATGTATATNQNTTATNNSATTGIMLGATTATNNTTGGGQAHGNIQPSLVVYMWLRTA